MRRKPYLRRFRDREMLREMLTLRGQGWSLSELARKYSVDHSSIRHWCIKFNLIGSEFKYSHPNKQANANIDIQKIPNDARWIVDEFGDRICRGKPYNEVLKEQGIKKPRKYFDEDLITA